MTAKAAKAQSQSNGSTATVDPIDSVFTASDSLIPKMLQLCKTKTCTSLVNQEAALVTQAEQDHANGVLKGNKRHDFYENYRTLLQQITNEMEKSLTPQELQLLKSCKACQNMKSSRNDESSPNVRDGATGVRFHPKMLLV